MGRSTAGTKHELPKTRADVIVADSSGIERGESIRRGRMKARFQDLGSPSWFEAMNRDEIRLGVIGCGGFGLFALQHFTQVPGVTLVGMAGTHRPAAYAAAQRFGVPDIEDVDALVRRDDVDVVYIATPPFLHHPQAMAALEAGKHVIVEKPLALTVAQADEMIAAARPQRPAAGRQPDAALQPALRRRPPAGRGPGAGRGAARVVRELRLGREPAGRPLVLGPRQERRHLRRARGPLLRPVRRLARARAGSRPPRSGSGRGPRSRSTSSARSATATSALVNFYHGFHQAGRMDRQELRLVFERGDVTLFDWVPTRARIHALVDERQTRDLCDLFPGARLDVTASYGGKDRACRGRRQGDRRLPDHRAVLRRRPGEVARSTAGCSGR